MANLDLSDEQYRVLGQIFKDVNCEDIQSMLKDAWSVIQTGRSVSDVQLHPNPSASLAHSSSNEVAETGFAVNFPTSESNDGKQWMFSSSLNKLYVKRDTACPINFKTQIPMELGTFVRATSFYVNAELAKKPVRRCYNHIEMEKNHEIGTSSDELRENLIRNVSEGAFYQKNSEGHLSVAVPFENPPDGSSFSTYVYKFLCFNSCSGGPNRKPLKLVFTLEKGIKVLGYHEVNLRVCSNLQRDIEAETNSSSRKNTSLNASIPLARSVNNQPKDVPQRFPIVAHDREMYLYLRKMRKIYKTMLMISKMSPEQRKHLFNYWSSSDTSS